MSLSGYYLEYGRHVARLHRRRRRRRAYAPTSNTTGYDNMKKSTHGFPPFPYMGMGLRLAALRATGAPLKTFSDWASVEGRIWHENVLEDGVKAVIG